MSVCIRFSRAGSKKRPFFRLVVADRESPRDGRFLERIGTYDPVKKGESFTLKQDRYNYWIGVGALPSHTVHNLVKRRVRAEVSA